MILLYEHISNFLINLLVSVNNIKFILTSVTA